MDFSMIKQAMELKNKMTKVQKELAKTFIEEEALDGQIKVTVTGQQKLMKLEIRQSLLDEGAKADYLAKEITKAVIKATEKSQKIADEKMKELTGGINLPGLT